MLNLKWNLQVFLFWVLLINPDLSGHFEILAPHWHSADDSLQETGNVKQVKRIFR